MRLKKWLNNIEALSEKKGEPTKLNPINVSIRYNEIMRESDSFVSMLFNKDPLVIKTHN